MRLYAVVHEADVGSPAFENLLESLTHSLGDAVLAGQICVGDR